MSERVQKALDSTEIPDEKIAAGSTQRHGWLRPVAGLAVAATVAFMAVFSVAPYLSSENTDGFSQVAERSAESFASPNILSAGPVTRPVSLKGGVQKERNKLNAYILRHHQVAGATTGSGFVSFVPIVAATSITAANEEVTSESTTQSDSEEPDN